MSDEEENSVHDNESEEDSVVHSEEENQSDEVVNNSEHSHSDVLENSASEPEKEEKNIVVNTPKNQPASNAVNNQKENNQKENNQKENNQKEKVEKVEKKPEPQEEHNEPLDINDPNILKLISQSTNKDEIIKVLMNSQVIKPKSIEDSAKETKKPYCPTEEEKKEYKFKGSK